MPYATRCLRTRKSALTELKLETVALPDPQAGQVVCRIDLLSLSSNNITYAAFGEAMDYWRFFPTGDPDWGQIPAWGYATVIASAVPELPVGERLFGYWPLATHAVLEPAAITALRCVDDSAHRRPLVAIYNRYTRVHADPDWRPAIEGLHALLMPLFLTAWMLADQLADQDFHGARRIVFSSASSKTAWLTAWCLRAAGIDAAQLALIGLTSTGNRDYVAALGLFDAVMAYDQLDALATEPTGVVYVDFSGDPGFRRRLHAQLGADLRASLFAGSAQHAQAPDLEAASDLPGPQPQAFFAPTQVRKRNADWGAAEVARRFSLLTQALYTQLSSPAGDAWLALETHVGMAAAAPLVRALLAGGLSPRQGLLLQPNDGSAAT